MLVPGRCSMPVGVSAAISANPSSLTSIACMILSASGESWAPKGAQRQGAAEDAGVELHRLPRVVGEADVGVETSGHGLLLGRPGVCSTHTSRGHRPRVRIGEQPSACGAGTGCLSSLAVVMTVVETRFLRTCSVRVPQGPRPPAVDACGPRQDSNLR